MTNIITTNELLSSPINQGNIIELPEGEKAIALENKSLANNKHVMVVRYTCPVFLVFEQTKSLLSFVHCKPGFSKQPYLEIELINTNNKRSKGWFLEGSMENPTIFS